jgi:hypothetical protein
MRRDAEGVALRRIDQLRAPQDSLPVLIGQRA